MELASRDGDDGEQEEKLTMRGSADEGLPPPENATMYSG